MPSASGSIVAEAGRPGNRLVVATAGHVDHGKTSLVRALTGVDTDRLPEEKRRGISIELGFAELFGAGVSFVDVPGHERLVHTMIAGASGVEHVLLVVAADEGVMPQTREHLAVCAVLGIRHALLALTKSDLVDEETLALCEAEASTAARELGIDVEGVFRTSVLTGAGVSELRTALSELPRRSGTPAPAQHALLAIDRTFTMPGAGTVVTGTLTRGELWREREVFVVGSGQRRPTSCRRLQVHGRDAMRVRAPSRVAVNLSRLKPAEVPRGAMLSSDEGLCLSRRFGVELRVLPGVDGELVPGRSLVVHLGTARVAGRIVWRSASLAELRLERPLPAAAGLIAVLRSSKRGAFGRVLGGARLLDAEAEGARGKSQRELTARAWNALAAGSIAQGLTGLLRARAPRTLSVATLERRVGLEPGTAASRVTGELERGELVSVGERWALGASVTELVTVAARELERFHEREPHATGLSRETLRDLLLRQSDDVLADLVLSTLVENGRAVAMEGGLVALPQALAQGAKERNAVRARVAERLGAAGLEGAPENDLAAAAGVSGEQTRVALGELVRAAQARRLGSLWFAEAALERLRQRVREHFLRKPTLSVPELKALAGVSRKQAIPLLEQLDREGTTRRKGDDRVAGAKREG